MMPLIRTCQILPTLEAWAICSHSRGQSIPRVLDRLHLQYNHRMVMCLKLGRRTAKPRKSCVIFPAKLPETSDASDSAKYGGLDNWNSYGLTIYYTLIYIYIYMYIYICMMCIYIHIRRCLYSCIHQHTLTHTLSHTHGHTHTDTYMYIYIYVYVYIIYTERGFL